MTLLAVLLSFPTVFFTVLLSLALIYWLFVLLGALDHNLLGGGDHAISGVAKGGLDALAHTGVEGAAEGAADGVVGETAEATLPSLVSALKLRSAPVTVVLTLFAAFGFLGSGLTSMMVERVRWPFGVLLFAAVSTLALLLTSLVIRPLGEIFETRRGRSHASLVGQIVIVTTSHVTPTFGQALLEDHGTSLSLPIGADSAASIKRGARCVLIDWDAAAGRFAVEPLPNDQGETATRIDAVLAAEGDLGSSPRFDARRRL
jgi:hypothetical protein